MTGLLLLYAGLLLQQEKKWRMQEDAEQWNKWEEYELIREEMGHTKDIVPIPKRALHKKRLHPPRKEHGH